MSFGIKTIYCQNLILNYSFEDTVSAPSPTVSIENAIYWQNPTSTTPDYYNSQCQIPIADGVPNNSFGYQHALTGSAYGGIYGACQSTSGGPLDCREYIQGQLSDTLISGNTYSVSFYVSFSNNSNVAITKIGAYLSATPISMGSGTNFPFIPQVVSTPGNYLTDTLNWVLIGGDFLASGGEKYITIGNFDDASTIDTINVPSSTTGGVMAYYYIDDVSVSFLSGIEEKRNNFAFSIYPNPANDKIIIESNNSTGSIFLYDMLGNVIKEISLTGMRAEIDISNLPGGIYHLQNGLTVKRLVISH